MTTLANVVRQLTELLEKRGIPYAVMGAWQCAFMAYLAPPTTLI